MYTEFYNTLLGCKEKVTTTYSYSIQNLLPFIAFIKFVDLESVLNTDVTSLSELSTCFRSDGSSQSGEFRESVPFIMHD